jgi:hypothetical protein
MQIPSSLHTYLINTTKWPWSGLSLWQAEVHVFQELVLGLFPAFAGDPVRDEARSPRGADLESIRWIGCNLRATQNHIQVCKAVFPIKSKNIVCMNIDERKKRYKGMMSPDWMLPDWMLPDWMLPNWMLPDRMLPDRMLPDWMLPDWMSPDWMLLLQYQTQCRPTEYCPRNVSTAKCCLFITLVLSGCQCRGMPFSEKCRRGQNGIL